MESSDERYTIISADGHVGAPLWDYKPYLERRWHREFDAWAAAFADPWVELEKDDFALGVANLESEYSWNGERRRQLLEADGIVAEVLFPNTAPPFFPSSVITAGAPRSRDEYERRMAGLRAHNRWLAEFCAELPGRRAGVGQVFLNDVDDTLKEIRSIKESGLTGGILLPGDSVDGLVQLYYPRYEPIWQLCEELDMPINKHSTFPADAATPTTGTAGPLVGMIEAVFFFNRMLSHLVFSGVFDRHPNLKVVFTEGGTSWAKDLLAGYDQIAEASKVTGSIIGWFARENAPIERRPSEYFGTNCYLSASSASRDEIDAAYEIGIDRYLWGADLPHREGTHPFTREALRATFAERPPSDVRKVLSETAAKVYGFDLAYLDQVAAGIGPTVEEINTPLTVWPKYPEETVTMALSNFALPGRRSKQT